MAVLFFDGFDMGAMWRTTNVVPGGSWDHQGNPNWAHGSGGTNRQFHYRSGYLGGQSFVWDRTFTWPSATFSVSNEVRISWMGKPDSVGSSSNTPILSLRHHNTSMYLIIRAAGLSGGLPVCDIGVISGNTEITSPKLSAGTFTLSSDWAHYEFYANATTGAVQVKKNGEVVLNETLVFLSTEPFSQVALRRHENLVMQWDHFIVTNGESLRDTTGYHGVAVTYAVGGPAATGFPTVRGRLDIAGNTYFGSYRTPAMSGASQRYAPAALNVYHEYWMENPATDAAWGATLPISAWGLCRGDAGVGWLVFPCMFLSFIEMHLDGYPLVRYETPTNTLSIDESVWVRTHPERPWHEHVDNYPRRAEPWRYSIIPLDSSTSAINPNPFNSASPKDWSSYAYDDFWYEDYLGVTGPGCISFGSTVDELEPPTTYGGTGLAFAEEYRITYRDWQSIIIGGDDFCSYFVTGYKLHGDASKKFQSNYLTVNYETDVLGSAYIQGVWDYALANTPDDAHSRSDTGRWGQTQQIYGVRNDEAYKHAFAKLKIRGHGRAMQMKVKCQSGKPFWLNGWSMFVTGNSTT